MLTSPFFSSAMPYCVLGGAGGSWSLSISSLRLVLLLPLVSRVAEEFPSPPRPHPSVCPQNSVTLKVHSMSPGGNSSTPGLSVPLGDSTPPNTP